MDYNSQLEALKASLNDSLKGMEFAKASINNSITSEVLETMTPSQVEMVNKSRELMNIGLENPEKLLKKQKEISNLMEVAKAEVEAESLRNAKKEQDQKESKK